MLARCGQRVRRSSLLPSKRTSLYQDCPRCYQTPTSPRRAARSSRTQKQSTVQIDDLPLRANDSMGKPMEAMGEFRPGNDSKKARTKGKGKAETEIKTAEEQAFVVPRLDEVGPDGQVWPPLAKDVLTNLARFPSCILLTRVGGFYESYFDQAPLLSTMLGIKLANRNWGGRNATMAGFPIVQLEKYLKMLVVDHKRLVAICDEFKEIESVLPPSPTSSGKRATSSKSILNETINIKRRVTRVVSPGTLIDEHFLDPFSSNWVLSISKIENRYGLAWLDVSTADFYTTCCHDEQSLRDEVARIGPTEVVLERGVFDVRAEESSLGDAATIEPNGNALWEVLDPSKTHISLCLPNIPESLNTIEDEDVENVAVSNLTQHLRTRLLEHDIHKVEDLTGERSGPLRQRREQVMLIDANTLIALEINSSMRRQETAYNTNSVNPSVKGSLLSNIRRTVTKGGARLLAQWLSAPSTSLSVIHRRQALVSLFHSQSFFMEDIRILLRRGAGDINRALQRIITSRNDVQDLLEVRDFTRLCQDLVKIIESEIRITESGSMGDHQEGWLALKTVMEAFVPLGHLSERLGGAIDENVIERRLQIQQDREREVEVQVLNEAASLSTDEKVKKVGIPKRQEGEGEESENDAFWGQAFEHLIRPSASKQLETLTKEHRLLRRRARTLELELRAKYSERISLKHLLGQGFVVHLNDYREGQKGGASTIEQEMSLAYKSKTTRTYYLEAFTKIGSRLMRVERELNEKETIELERLRMDVLVELGKLRKNSSLVNELDVLLGFSKLAQELYFCRPTVNDSEDIEIIGGRHLSVELSLLHQHSSTTNANTLTIPVATRSFTPNDLHLHPDSRLHLITGPNMGGKSTLLRMVSIITILAQIGSFVPATSCSIGIVDQIFSRIGAHDSINTEKSTFMVEMLEVSEFLKRSTKKSLVICDEIGRGTDHKTGIAIAFATALHLLDEIQCKCLFATHLYDVGDMLEGRPGIDFFCTDLKESEDGIVFSHRLQPGLNRNSHGLSIARLAGVPEKVLRVAQTTLDDLRKHDD